MRIDLGAIERTGDFLVISKRRRITSMDIERRNEIFGTLIECLNDADASGAEHQLHAIYLDACLSLAPLLLRDTSTLRTLWSALTCSEELWPADFIFPLLARLIESGVDPRVATREAVRIVRPTLGATHQDDIVMLAAMALARRGQPSEAAELVLREMGCPIMKDVALASFECPEQAAASQRVRTCREIRSGGAFALSCAAANSVWAKRRALIGEALRAGLTPLVSPYVLMNTDPTDTGTSLFVGRADCERETTWMLIVETSETEARQWAEAIAGRPSDIQLRRVDAKGGSQVGPLSPLAIPGVTLCGVARGELPPQGWERKGMVRYERSRILTDYTGLADVRRYLDQFEPRLARSTPWPLPSQSVIPVPDLFQQIAATGLFDVVVR